MCNRSFKNNYKKKLSFLKKLSCSKFSGSFKNSRPEGNFSFFSSLLERFVHQRTTSLVKNVFFLCLIFFFTLTVQDPHLHQNFSLSLWSAVCKHAFWSIIDKLLIIISIYRVFGRPRGFGLFILLTSNFLINWPSGFNTRPNHSSHLHSIEKSVSGLYTASSFVYLRFRLKN